MADGSYQLAIAIPVDVSQVAPATAAVTNLGTAGKAATDAATDLAKAQAGMATQTRGMDQANRSANAGLVNLVRQMSDVGVMATMGASPLQILATQGEQIAFAAKEAGPALLRLLPALSGVAVAAAVAGTAWTVYANLTADGTVATERARDAMMEAGREAAALGGALSSSASKGWQNVDAAASQAATGLATLAGVIGRAAAASSAEVEKIRADAMPAMLELGKRQAAITIALDEAVKVANSGGTGAAEAARQAAELRPALAEVTAELRRRKEALKDAIDTTLALGAVTDANTDADDRARAAAEALAEAKRRQAEAERRAREEAEEAAKAARAARAALDAEVAAISAFYEAGSRGLSAVQQISDKIEALAPKKALTATEQLTLLQADLTAEFSRGSLSLEAYNAEMSRLAEVTAQVADAEAQRRQDARVEGTAQGLSGPNAVMQGVSSAGPWGALIAAIVELVRDFKGVGDQFNDFTVQLNESISKLPETLGENLGRWLESGTEATLKMFPELVASLLSNVDDIMASMTDAFAAVFFDESNWTSVGEAVGQGLVDFVMGSFGTKEGGVSFWSVLDGLFLGGMGENIGGMFGGHKASGGYIASPGMYRLHQGEVVYNASQVQTDAKQSSTTSRRGRMFGQAGRLYIEVDADSLADTMSGLSGRGYSFAAEGA